MTLSSIWAQDRNGVIGSGTGMLWRVPADQAFFKEQTMGQPIIMGRASWEALGGALPGRENIIITSKMGYVAPGATVVSSLAQALAHVEGEDAWITGGAQVYAQTINLVDRLVVSQLDLEVGPGVKAPPIDPKLWRLDPAQSDSQWRPQSGDARWRIEVYVRSTH